VPPQPKPQLNNKRRREATPPGEEGAQEAEASPHMIATAAMAQARRQVLRLLTSMGVPGDKVERAVEATAEEHSADVESWLDAAQEWLAVDNECVEDADRLREAMQESLAQAEQRKAAAKQVGEMEAEELKQARSKGAGSA
jgi:molecular chaperone DnaK (HSP70)